MRGCGCQSRKVEVVKLVDVLAVYMCTVFPATLIPGDQHWQLLMLDKNGDVSEHTLVIFSSPSATPGWNGLHNNALG